MILLSTVARTLFVLLFYLVAPFGLLTWRANAAAYDSRSLRAVHNGGTASGVLSLSACGPCFSRLFFSFALFPLYAGCHNERHCYGGKPRPPTRCSKCLQSER